MTPPDAAGRERAATDTKCSLLVEASAGTGKTSALIRRILRLVLEGGVPLREIAAMTFTEKAAGEMKTRLRTEFAETLSKEPEEEKRQRALRATLDLDAAEISTIHSFCARLLRERPVEAGVDPDFVAGDELLAADLSDEVFAAWFDRAARRDPGPVAAALRAGIGPETIRSLALALHEKRLVLDGAVLPSDAGDEVRERASRLAAAYQRIVPLFSSEKDLPKKECVEAVIAALRGVVRASDHGLKGEKPDLRIALRGHWPEEAKAAVESSRDDVDRLLGLLADLPLVPVLTDLVREIRASFFAEIEEAKRRDGILDFDDLLLSARDLLRASRAAREHFFAKYRTLLVDEFQDTDPVQAEVVLRLAASPERQDGPWTALEPEAGRLFLVGDPKQSIYRFRRADIETYAGTAARFPADRRILLTSNFRSDQPLLDFVNEVGPALLPAPRGEEYAVGYTPLAPSDATKPGRPPAVLFLSPPEPSTGATAAAEPGTANGDSEDLHVREQEARAVANLLVSRFSQGEKPWSRIAVLVPRHATVELLATAFRDAGIPFVLEGGRSFYRREEIAAVVQALRAVDDPSDAIAVVAALKSVLFGVPDDALLDAAVSGASFGDPSTFGESSPLYPAMQLLYRLHRERHARPVAATLADLLAARQTFAAVENGAVANSVQGLANLERLLAFARDLEHEGLSFREAVRRFLRRTEEEAPEPTAFTEETDAVRLMTLHRAKGLEFPVVVLADFGLKERTGSKPKPLVVFERAGGRFAVRLAAGGRTIGTARLAEVEAAEELRLAAEERRLLYVGLTRAKETLVVSWFRKRSVKKNGDVSDGLSKSLLAPLQEFEEPAGHLARLVEVVEADLSPRAPAAAAEIPPPAADVEREMADATERLERARSLAARPLRRAGEKMADSAPATPEDIEPADRDDAPDRSRRIGLAVHDAMQRLLGDPRRPDEATAARAFAFAFGELLPDERAEAAALVRALLSHPVSKRALAAPRRYVEMPLLYRDASLPGSPLVEGKIDLLFEEADGWQIVDWKTDRLLDATSRAEREALYAPQLRAYEEGLRKTLGPGARVKPGLLVFARLAEQDVGPGLAPP